jgi:ubiquinone/menaquinone biosynthesis C-methylase UbiE
MINLPLKLLARIDAIWLAQRRWRLGRQVVTPGAGVHGSGSLPYEQIEGIWWPTGFPTMAHCFWRAQEATLFRRHAGLISGKVLDVGCGDGIFGELAGFPENTTGIDLDQTSLQVRRNVVKNAESVYADARDLPFKTEAFDTIVSNSVFEHLPDLPKCFAEFRRVLSPSGCLAFTMTLSGAKDAAYWTGAFGHLQQPTRRELESSLAGIGFELHEVAEYQPEWSSAVYRRLVSPMAQFFERRWSPSHRRMVVRQLALKVKQSLQPQSGQCGACVWVVARKAVGQ